MKVIKYLFILLLLELFFINSVFGEIVAKTSTQYDDKIDMTNVSNNILSEIILIIPKEVFLNVSSINALQFTCYKNFSNPPNQNLVFRFFKYYGFGVFSPIDNSYITPSQCIDYHYQITWNLWNSEIVDHNYDYAFGIYSANVNNGSWYYEYLSEYGNLSNPYLYSWLNVSNNNPIINVSIVDINGLLYSDNGSYLRNYPDFKVLGTLLTPTATPTPTPTGTPIITNNSLGTPLNNSTNSNDLYNLSNNPNGLNEISIGNGTGETVGSIVDKINASSLGYTIFGFMIWIIRFFSIKKDVN